MNRLRWSGNIQAQQQADAAYAKLQPKQKKLKTKSKRQKRRAARRAAAKERAKSFVRPDYYKCMASARWKKKRLAAIEHHGGKCAVCGSTRGIHVHHLHYRRLGREKMKDLKLLCAGCHANGHEGDVLGVLDPMTAEYLEVCGARPAIKAGASAPSLTPGLGNW